MTVSISQFFAELLVPFGEEPPPPITPPQVRTMRFDAGLRAEWYIVPQLTDSGDELLDKCVKPISVTGKMTLPKVSVYAYPPGRDINVDDIEEGINSATGKKSLPSTTHVQRSARRPINVPNAELWTVRLEGIWDGTGMKDRVDQITVEVAIQGVRR